MADDGLLYLYVCVCVSVVYECVCAHGTFNYFWILSIKKFICVESVRISILYCTQRTSGVHTTHSFIHAFIQTHSFLCHSFDLASVWLSASVRRHWHGHTKIDNIWLLWVRTRRERERTRNSFTTPKKTHTFTHTESEQKSKLVSFNTIESNWIENFPL